MKTKINSITNLNPRTIDPSDVDELMANWRKCFPSELGNLFFHKAKDKIERYDTYELDNDSILKIVNELNEGGPSGGNVKSLSVLMGKGQPSNNKKGASNGNLNDIFRPILKVILFEPVNNRREYFFILSEEDTTYKLIGPIMHSDHKKEISPKIAELFILKWQSLTDGEIINAFDCQVADKTVSEPTDNEGILFGTQKLRRVNLYRFDYNQTQSIISRLRGLLGEYEKISFFVNLGAGLTIADIHPFNFRPIIRILASNDKRSSKAGDTTTNFYDTSKPCPPFCSNNNESIINNNC